MGYKIACSTGGSQSNPLNCTCTDSSGYLRGTAGRSCANDWKAKSESSHCIYRCAGRALRLVVMCAFGSVLVLALGPTVAARADSCYRQRPDDPRAVYLTNEQFGAHADGMADDSDALQQAIDRVASTTRQGVVFIPEGKYLLTKTVHVWQGIRLVGYGEHRPVLVLGPNTPGFQEGTGHYMVWFADNRPAAGGPVSRCQRIHVLQRYE